MDVNIRKKCRKIISITTIFTMMAGMYLTMNSENTYAEAQKNEYIVITENQNGLETIRNGYDIIEDNNDENSNGESMVTAEMTEAQAQNLLTDEDIKCVEQDFLIEPYEEASEEMVKPIDRNWAIDAVNAENAQPGGSRIKIAVLDSGIDFTDNIEVAERKNFIDDMPVTTPLFEDTCGHGTSVASVICGTGNESNVVGVNNNALLYSARVLDDKKQAPVSRIVQAIYWAIDKDVDIINISFGTRTYSESLKTAIDDVVSAGILVVAAAGNHGSDGIDYPAAFDNTLAVGAVNAAGSVSDFSSVGDKIDVVAPGEAVAVQGNFGEDLVMSGTSLAAPYVAGIAGLLWSKDTTKDSEFIKALIQLSAKKMEGQAGSGYGLVDYEYAMQIYDEVEERYEAIQNSSAEQGDSTKENSNNDNKEHPTAYENNVDMTDNTTVTQAESNEEKLLAGDDENTAADTGNLILEETEKADILENGKQTTEAERTVTQIEISDNPEEVIDLSDPIVDGSWRASVHQAYYENNAMKNGAVYADNKGCHSFLYGIGDNPEFHGFSWQGTAGGLGSGDCNFMATYKYLVKVAAAYGAGNGYTSVSQSDVQGLDTTSFSNLRRGFSDILAHDKAISVGESAVLWGVNSDELQRAFVLGLAMHTATDAFAHSAFYIPQNSTTMVWQHIAHDPVNNADNETFRDGRYYMALEVEKKVVSRYNGNRTGFDTCNDFYNTNAGAYSNLDFRITKMRTFAEEAGYSNSTVLGDYGKLQSW